MKSRPAGFTLVELIIVMLLIGILAGVAIPRFINQTTNARIAALEGLAGAINSAVMLAQVEYQGEQRYTSPINMSGILVTVVTGTQDPGIPSAATPSGITSALVNFGTAESQFTVTYSGSTGSAMTTFSLLPNCYLTYYDVSGAVYLTTNGC